MTFDENLQELKKEGWTDESLDQIRKSWSSVEMDEMYAGMDQTKRILNLLKSYINDINTKLVNKRELSVEDRSYDLGRRDMANTIMNLFDSRDYSERRKQIISATERSDN